MTTDRRRRTRSTIWACLFVAGMTVLALVGPGGRRFVMPGPLARPHAAIREDCGRCHVGPDGRVKSFLHGVAPTEAALAESALCLRCHDFREHALAAHSLPPSELDRMSVRAREGLLRAVDPPWLLAAAAWIGPPASAAGELACSACHLEHRGSDSRPRNFADRRCLTCHAAKFRSFSADHPEFDGYPYLRRTHLIFDHGSHRAKHFPKRDAPYACESCHRTDRTERYMESGSFETTCTSCHDHVEEIAGAGRMESGVAFLRLPALDTVTLEQRGRSIGDWPASAEDEYDGVATPFMNFLLSGDPRYPEINADRVTLAGLDVLDLRGADEQQILAVERYAVAVKRLVRDLARGGSGALQALHARAAGPDATLEQIELLAAAHSTAALRAAQAAWFPKETAAGSGGDPRWEASGAWYINADDLALVYQPAQHLDRFLQTWLDVAGESAPASPAARELFRYLAEDDGRCTRCHSVDVVGAGLRVNWNSLPLPENRPFTRFSHAPHLLMAGDDGCESCHVLNAESGYLASFENNTDALSFSSGHEAVTREMCARCHRREASGETCTLCHNYHVGRFPPRLPGTVLTRRVGSVAPEARTARCR